MICTNKLYSCYNTEWESIFNRFQNTEIMKLKEMIVFEILSGGLTLSPVTLFSLDLYKSLTC